MAGTGPEALTVHVWTPTGTASIPVRQRLVHRYVISVNGHGHISTGHAALELGEPGEEGALYVSHYPAVEIDRSPDHLRATLRAGPENDVPGRFLPSYREEADDWCEATVTVTLHGIDGARLRRFWAAYRRDTTYNLVARNCSTTVACALDAAVEGRVQPERQAVAHPRPGGDEPGILGGRAPAQRCGRDDMDAGSRARLFAGAQRPDRSRLAGPGDRLERREAAAPAQLARRGGGADAEPRPTALAGVIGRRRAVGRSDIRWGRPGPGRFGRPWRDGDLQIPMVPSHSVAVSACRSDKNRFRRSVTTAGFHSCRSTTSTSSAAMAPAAGLSHAHVPGEPYRIRTRINDGGWIEPALPRFSGMSLMEWSKSDGWYPS